MVVQGDRPYPFHNNLTLLNLYNNCLHSLNFLVALSHHPFMEKYESDASQKHINDNFPFMASLPLNYNFQFCPPC